MNFKKGKKVRATSAQRREWLRRFEEGETPQDIAKGAGFDPRTVKSQIKIAQQQREFVDARSQVLRSALERHYDDICQFAKELKVAFYLPPSFSSNPGGLTGSQLQDPLLAALKEHLPRAPLWRDISVWDEAGEAYKLAVRSLSERIRKELNKSANRWKGIGELDIDLLFEAIKDDFGYHLLAISRGESGLRRSVIGKKTEEIALRRTELTDLPEEMQSWLCELLDKTQEWEEFKDWSMSLERLERVRQDILSELDTIALRRVVTGRCRYCPF